MAFSASFQALLLLLPGITSTEWVLGGSGESCAKACIGVGLQCSSKELYEQNAVTNSEREVAALIASFNETCVSYKLEYGSNGDVPAFQKSNGECYISDITRQVSTFKCERSTSAGKHRLCWCHTAATSVAVGCAQNHSDDSAGINKSLVIWIISGNMLALGLLCMCCGVLQRLLRKCQGKAEEPNLSTRPEDPRIFVRCPACGCPLERSQAAGTATFNRVQSKFSQKSSLGLRQGDVMSEGQPTTQTVKFCETISEVSPSQSIVPTEV
jgi:hypothetical protein